MPKRDTVTIKCSQRQVVSVENWLRNEFKPSSPTLLVGQDFTNHDEKTAHEMALLLGKKIKRKRSSELFGLLMPRSVAEWFGSFTANDIFCNFTFSNPRDVVLLSKLCTKVTTRKVGCPRLVRRNIQIQIANFSKRREGSPDNLDDREHRRLKKRESNNQWLDEIKARGETLLTTLPRKTP